MSKMSFFLIDSFVMNKLHEEMKSILPSQQLYINNVEKYLS